MDFRKLSNLCSAQGNAKWEDENLSVSNSSPTVRSKTSTEVIFFVTISSTAFRVVNIKKVGCLRPPRFYKS